MDFNKLLDKWYEKHTLTLNEYNKITSNNEEVKQMCRSKMTQILEFIEDLKQLSNSDSKETDFLNLSKSNMDLIHDLIFRNKFLNILNHDHKMLNYYVKVKEYYEELPQSIKEDGVRLGFDNHYVSERMYDWFKQNKGYERF